jgi:ribosome-binding protein aMBF1 (putative translation factor)
MTPKQCAAARAFLGWERADLARPIQISPQTVLRFEKGEAVKFVTVTMMRQTLEAAGIEFTGGDTVRLKPEGGENA